MDLTRSARSSLASSSSGTSGPSPPSTPGRKFFSAKRSLKNMRGRKSQQQQQDDEDLDFCCGGDEQQQEDDDMAGASEFDQVSPLPLYYKHGLMPSPDFEFPPQYPPGMSSESRHKAEQEKAVDALHEFFENRNLSRRTSHASINTSHSSSANNSYRNSQGSTQSAASGENPFPPSQRLLRSGSDGNLLNSFTNSQSPPASDRRPRKSSFIQGVQQFARR